MAESPFAPMDPLTQGMTPEEIMMLLQRQQLMQPGDYRPEMPNAAPPENPFVPSQTAGMPFEGNDLGQGTSDPASGKRFEDLLTAPAKGVVGQFDKAGSSLAEAAMDPSIPNIANAGVQSGAAMMRPMMMLGSGAIGVGDALMKDLGGVGSAEARGRKKAAPAPEPGSEEEYRQAQDKLSRNDFRTGNEKRDLLDVVKRYRENIDRNAGSQRTLEEERKRAEQGEYDRRTKRAEEVYETEMGRDRRWSDTATGKFMDKMGGWDPFVAAMGAGGAVGKIQKMTGGHATSTLGKLGQEVSPFIAGTAAAFGVNNVADGYNAARLEPDNPRKRALEGYGMELPEGHPRKQSSLDAAAPMKDTNPVRDAALRNLTDPKVMAGRLGISAIEGLGAPVSAGLVRGRSAGAASGAGAGPGATPLAPSGPAAPGPSLGPPGGPPALPKQAFDPARLALPTPAQKASGFSKTMDPAELQAAAKAHREAMTKYRSDPDLPTFFEANSGLGPKKLREAFEAQYGPLRQKSVLKLRDSVSRDAAAKGVDEARMQLAETAKTAQGEARMIWDSIAQGGNASYRDVKQIMPELRAAYPALKDMTDRQLGNLIRKAAQGQ